jgi:hypothetical protein
MMAGAEATSSNGTILGAIITFLLYGALPIGLILYFMGAPARKRAIRAREAAELAAARPAATYPSGSQPDTGSQTAADTPVPPVGKEP